MTGSEKQLQQIISRHRREMSSQERAKGIARVAADLAALPDHVMPFEAGSLFGRQADEAVSISSRLKQVEALIENRHFDEALQPCEELVDAAPENGRAHCLHGDLLMRRGKLHLAGQAYSRALMHDPDLADAFAGRAEIFTISGRLDEADAACAQARHLAPEDGRITGLYAYILHKQGQIAEAGDEFAKAVSRAPQIAMTHMRFGNLLLQQGRLEDALASYERAIAIEPERAEFHCNKALACQAIGRLKEAGEAFARAIAIRPDFADAYARYGILLMKLGRKDEAIGTLRKAVELSPKNKAARLNLAGALKEADLCADAADAYRNLLQMSEGANSVALFEYCHLRHMLCDWPGLEDEEQLALRQVLDSGARVPPFGALAMQCKPDEQLALARLWAGGFRGRPDAVPLFRQMPRSTARDDRIRLGYLSSDFYEHATASLIAELFEQHDRQQFEVIAYCYSRDDGSDMRRRLIAAFDRFVPIHELPHAEAAKGIAGDGVDILIDLKGYTRGARSMIPALRPAPIQVNFLGYPGTMGAGFIDYVIADPVVAPMAHQAHFDEKIIHLPGSYQPNDRKRQTSGKPRVRADHGLPEEGFVFCAFNSSYKITPAFFDIWMRLLSQLPSAVLWLLDPKEPGRTHLRREALLRGVAPDRLVFAPHLRIDEHQARYAFADLFLDNLPVCAHTTASEALWSGIPVVTCLGDAFAGRVATSLVQACGLPDLATDTLDEYEALALRLATDRPMMAGIRARLEEVRQSGSIFDARQYARNIEAAYRHMIQHYKAGGAPLPFAIDAAGAAKLMG